jgi:glyoxylase-like metal-dependent hydrolase (beta-lactamase superfamily II)
MKTRVLTALLALCVLSAAAWLVGGGSGEPKTAGDWKEVAPGVWRSPGTPAGYALIDSDAALLIDAPCGPDGLKAQGVKQIDAVLLTHHHRDTAAFAGRYLADKVPVRASKASAEWLTPEGVQKYWKESLPLRNSRTAYLVLPEGLAGVDCSLADGQMIDWHGWTVTVVDAPGHSRDHTAYAARKGKDGRLLLFCGDALSAPGKLWSPYTTDWDHWTDLGLKPTYQTLRKLTDLKPDALLPAHGDPIAQNAVAALTRTADAAEEVGFLKSFERYTKERLKDAPKYAFLAKEQAESNGSKPWSQISEHLFITGNTYVLVSRDTDNPFMVIDPWDPYSAAQIPKIKVEERLGKLEVVMCSHAHFDHYDGVYTILDRDKPEVWTLDRVAVPIADPYLLRAPFLDPRPVKIDKRPKDGDVLTWREYRLRFHHLPGQTEFTMGVETTIDGKKCYFTADNFFHQDQFSGTGGWMGLNRSYPLPYSESAQKVLDAAPDWVLAEHGGPFEFNAEDFRRRVQWGKECAKAADAVCVSGSLVHDWNPSRVRVEPLVQKAKPGASLNATLVASNPLDHAEKLTVVLEGRWLTEDQTWELEVGAGGEVRKEFTLKLADKAPDGRLPLALRVRSGEAADGGDAFVVVDVER